MLQSTFKSRINRTMIICKKSYFVVNKHIGTMLWYAFDIFSGECQEVSHTILLSSLLLKTFLVMVMLAKKFIGWKMKFCIKISIKCRALFFFRFFFPDIFSEKSLVFFLCVLAKYDASFYHALCGLMMWNVSYTSQSKR